MTDGSIIGLKGKLALIDFYNTAERTNERWNSELAGIRLIQGVNSSFHGLFQRTGVKQMIKEMLIFTPHHAF